ncbi:MAG: DASS family sodium-coupled anion symporter [Crocinitomicaceae bacterium]|nr:DASS family sodium-coupled anion symporter [Crocinitomicaceae bacterium]
MPIKNWKTIAVPLGFIIFALIILLTGGKSLMWNAGALGFLMVYFWILEIIPIYVTALFPLIFAVPLGLSAPTDLATSYGNSVIYLFLGGFLIANALEKWDIHIQFTRRILKLSGQSKVKILLGFLSSTAFLSMWISNTATALMMLPMAIAVIDALPEEKKEGKFPILLLLSIAFAASIGGIATLVGSPPNLIMAAILSKTFNIQIDFITWFKWGFPLSVILVAVVYFLFSFLLGKERNEKVDSFSLKHQKWTPVQLKVLAIFFLTVFLWTFKTVIANYTGFKYSDESAVILTASLLFLFPGEKKDQKLLEWKDTEKLPWGILLLFGGGLALADILFRTGIVDLVSNSFNSMIALPYLALIFVIVLITTFGSELLSNTAQVTIMIPVIALFAVTNDLPVIQLCFAVTVAASCAFMMPMGTPPNAIVFASGKIKMYQMAKIGFVLNLIIAVIVTAFTFLYVEKNSILPF